MDIQVKRAYNQPAADDGTRVLVDRVWPRGVKKEDLGIEEWMKDIGPSTELRKWFGHDPEKWADFRERYFKELDGKPELVDHLCQLARHNRLTLVFGAKDETYNQAVALREYLRNVK
jgi:uncharacterized protein YeaO (DUF488 family)